ncbi:MAG: hypothetical protein LBQ28_07130 [Prevotellaceae bacterium]|jgi:hypothetical protein|nr:hypothetical protein [Prevotellaceae bacterium]
MTKKIYFMLILAVAGIAGAKAQMRIGGSEMPNQSAVLDLNPDDNVSAGHATLGLALPRVNLRDSGDAFPLVSHVEGMTVYNMATAGDVKPGVYINNGVKWLRQLNSDTPVLPAMEKDSIVGNEVFDATVDGGLIRSGAGTAATPYTLGIAEGGVTTFHIDDSAINTTKISDNAVTSEKIADSTITNADISSSAAIDLTKIAFPSASENSGKVLKSNGSTWIADADNNTSYTAGDGLTLSGTTFNIGTEQINSTMIANGTIIAADLSSMGASSGQILKWDGTAWLPSADAGIASVSGTNGITVTNGTTAPVVSLPSGTKGQALVHNGTTWAAAAKWSPVYITNTSTASNSITSSGYTDAYVWTDLTPGLYSLRMRSGGGYIKFLLQSDVAFGTSAQFEINSNSHDCTTEIIFHYFYTGNLRLKALCTGNCPTRLANLTLHKFE